MQSESNDIFGLCIYKIERDEDLTDAGLRMSGAVLKLCTFKVAGVGYKLGESLLRQAFLFAVYNNLSAVYVQVRKGQQERLCRLLEEFGFDDVGSYKNDGEWVANIYGGNENLEAVEFIKHLNSIHKNMNHGALIIAEESTAWPRVTGDLNDDGLGFDYKWNMGWMNDFTEFMRYEGKDYSEILRRSCSSIIS